jgi:uncharacterized protein YunC (DUF1805 family)
VVLLDTVTRVPAMAADVFVTGSHGGVYAASLLARSSAIAGVFNDASGGLDDAGVAGLTLLDELGIPSVAVSHLSACIGDCASTLEGRISRVNAAAERLGCARGQSVRDAVAALEWAAPVDAAVPDYGDARAQIHTTGAGIEVWALDSAALVQESDAGRVIVTGSHGALLGGRPETALKWPAAAAVFNDAGGGPDGRGRSRLLALAERGIPAATVAASSARIGDGCSTFHDGVISSVNATARELGAHPGQTTVELVETVTNHRSAISRDRD